MNLNQIEMFNSDYNKFNKQFECVDTSVGQHLDWYLSLIDREPNIPLEEDKIEQLQSVEEHLLLCFACQDKVFELEDKKSN